MMQGKNNVHALQTEWEMTYKEAPSKELLIGAWILWVGTLSFQENYEYRFQQWIVLSVRIVVEAHETQAFTLRKLRV